MLPPPPKPPALTRSLSLLDLILLGIGASIGSGIFVVTGLPAVLAPGGLPISIPLPFLSPSWLLWWVSDWCPGDKARCHPY
ncbi:hypothetical protein CLOP_g14765 [Closterium sp. NIES-67]|nr:hypothetical protein CLOP_g14765 [Closterium sp. NIES-67]